MNAPVKDLHGEVVQGAQFFAPVSTDMVDGLIGRYRAMRANIEAVAQFIHGGDNAELEQNRDVKATWYRYFNQTFYGEDGVGWNVYVVDHGLRSTMSYLVNDLNWKIHAMRQDGGGCVVMIGQWLNVVYAKPWGDKAPKEMTETINAFMLEVLEKSHPHLQARAEWAQTVSIHELGLSSRIINLLEGAELDTLYKVMSHQGGKLDNIKGLGEKLVGQVIYACELAVKAWEQEHISAEEAA